MVLVIGSINMDVSFQVQDIPHPGETVMASGVKKSPGGKGANQAYAASKLGGKVTMLGCVGQDENGEALLASLDSAGVDISHIKKQADNATSSAFICVSASGENSIVVDSSANALVSPDYLAENESLFENAEYCILQMEIPYETVSAAIALCQKHQVKVVLNPSPLTAFDKQLLYGVDYLVPNETEASALIGMSYEQASEQDWNAFMQEYHIKNLIITLGKQGCRYYDGSKPSQAYPSERRDAIDTTGAGDTFLGALVAALSQGETIHNAIRYANAASGIEVTRHGAQQAVPTKEEVEYDLKEHSN